MLTPDDILQDRYRIVRRLSHGGMGAVYEAIDRRVKSTVAIKETFAMTEEGRRAFRHEAQRLANLEHEVFPKVFDHFEEGEGLYLVMQVVRGEDLAERLKERLSYHEGPFSPVKVLEWADQLLDALEMLHEYNPPIVHRDIKPSNLKLTQRGKIILLDFGIAKGVAGLMSATDGSIKAASPNFSPLEQILKIDETSIETLSSISEESVEKILRKGTGPRSNLYALGATLYCLMTGKLPTDSRLRALAIWAGRQDPLQSAGKLNTQVTEAVSDVLMQAMALDPNDRIANAASMRQRLREAVGEPIYTPPTIPLMELERRKDEARRRAEATTELQPIEEGERPWSEEETSRRDTEAQRERKTQEAIRLATEERERRDAWERQRAEEGERQQAEAAQRGSEEQRRKESAQARAEEEPRRHVEKEHAADETRVVEDERQESEAQRLATAEAEPRQANEERRRTEQQLSMREAGLEEEHTVEAQQPIVSAQRTLGAMPSDSLSVETIKTPSPERGALIGGESKPLVAAPNGRNRRATLVSVIGLVILVIVVIVGLRRYWENNNNQLASSNSSLGNNPSGTVQGGSVSASNLDGTATPSPAQSVTPPTGMVYVPGGEFTMGRDGDPTGYESPAHKVMIDPFYIDLYEVTREDYQKCVDEKKCQPPSIWESNKFPDGTTKLPVTGVTWSDANAFASWAGKRLPTEEEWEFAARGGAKEFRYPWGNEWKDGLANANPSSKGLAEVGSYQAASPFGAFDMVGNAWEWTASPFKAYKGGGGPAITDAMKRLKDLKVIRGCMYKCNKDQATATYRRGLPARGYRDYNDMGFRCAKDATK